MYESRISLGHGAINSKFFLSYITANEGYFWNAIKKFGIRESDLRKINPTQDDLLEIHSELMTFGFSTKYFLNMQTMIYPYRKK